MPSGFIINVIYFGTKNWYIWKVLILESDVLRLSKILHIPMLKKNFSDLIQLILFLGKFPLNFLVKLQQDFLLFCKITYFWMSYNCWVWLFSQTLSQWTELFDESAK